MSRSLHICTYASPYRRALGQLERSCKRAGAHLHVLGLDKPYRGFCEKFLAVQHFMQALPKADVLLFLDGYDTLLLASPEEILGKFLEINAPIVVSAEQDSYPDGTLAGLYPLSPTRFRYVNSGLYIGFVGALQEFFKAIEPFRAEDDDQAIMAHFFLDHPDKMRLDTGCRLFLNTANLTIDQIAIDEKIGRVHALETDSTPVAIHGNGKSLWYQYSADLLFPEEYAITLPSISSVTLALVGGAVPHLLQKQLEGILALDYPKEKITLFIDAYPATELFLQEWKARFQDQYKAVFLQEQAINPEVDLDPIAHFCTYKTDGARFEEAFQFAKDQKADFYMLVDWNVFLEPCALKGLIAAKKQVVAPLLRLFLATVDFSLNFECEPKELLQIVRQEVTGSFEVDGVSGCYLVDMRAPLQTDRKPFLSNEHHYGTMIALPEYPSAGQRREEIELLRLFFKNLSF